MILKNKTKGAEFEFPFIVRVKEEGKKEFIEWVVNEMGDNPIVGDWELDDVYQFIEA